jgi:hypothetical protein
VEKGILERGFNENKKKKEIVYPKCLFRAEGVPILP